MLKNTNQVMTSRFAYVDGIAAIARVAIKKMRTYIKWNLVFEHQEIFQTIITLEITLILHSEKYLDENRRILSLSANDCLPKNGHENTQNNCDHFFGRFCFIICFTKENYLNGLSLLQYI